MCIRDRQCTDQMATAIHNGDEMLDANDALRFILHTNPATPVSYTHLTLPTIYSV